jgi:hypothetical protein
MIGNSRFITLGGWHNLNARETLGWAGGAEGWIATGAKTAITGGQEYLRQG